MDTHSDNAIELNFGAAGEHGAPIGLPGEAPPATADPEERLSHLSYMEKTRRSGAFADALARVRGAFKGARANQGEGCEDAAGANASDEGRQSENEPWLGPDETGASPPQADAEGEETEAGDEALAVSEAASAAAVRSLWRRPALIGAASVAVLGVAAAAALLISSGDQGNAGKVAVAAQAGREPGLSAQPHPAELIAPAARLAATPTPAPVSAVVELPPPAAKDDLLKEVEGFRGAASSAPSGGGPVRAAAAGAGGGSVAAPVVAAATAPPAAATAASVAAPERVFANVPPGAGVREPGSSGAPPDGALLAAGSGRDKASETAQGALTPMVRVASVHDGDVASPAPAAVQPRAEAKPAADSMAKRVTPAEETQLYAKITELATLVRITREEVIAVQKGQKAANDAVDAKLQDIDRRLNLGEATRALDAANAVSADPAAPAPAPVSAPAPIPASAPARKAAGKGVITASLEGQAVDGALPRYRVQAASPGLAMLTEVDRSGDEAAPIQVAVGGQVPGYGRVLKISQRGADWVVQTEKGAIQ